MSGTEPPTKTIARTLRAFWAGGHAFMTDKRREKYEAKRVIRKVSLNVKSDADILAWLESQSEDFSVLIKKLLREKMSESD